MFPLRVRGREVSAYAPDWDPTTEPHRAYTLDLSHTAVSQLGRAGPDGRRWATGSRTCTSRTAPGAAKDEHLVPGRGTQPCGELLERLAARGFARLGGGRGEHPPRRPTGRSGEADLAEALAFTRLHLVATAQPVASAVR